jgi:GH15 family glucan-1,4-alpha-glucosidase
MNKFGLDLAVIGNGHTAALLEPASRLVWWCFPRLDSDPVFSRLLAGDDEKGFCDVVLEDMVDYASDYERNTAIVSTILTNSQGAQVKIPTLPRVSKISAACSGRRSWSAS